MLYAKTRTDVPSSRYGGYIQILRETGWTWAELGEQPADLIDEMLTMLNAEARSLKHAGR